MILISFLRTHRFRPFTVRSAPLLAGLLIAACAGQAPPAGGPEDFDPPTIVSVVPAPYTTSFTGRSIVLEFSEYVHRASVNESVFISPSVGPLEFDWSGKEVEISFTRALKENTTYVVNVGTDVRDIRNDNRMAQAFVLAFSTGDSIDRGAMEGRVFPAQAGGEVSGIMLFAYKLDGLDPDTLDPTVLQPDYITQTGSDGGFFFRHLTLGRYRVCAVRDRYRDLLYNPETDEYGVLSRDILLTPEDTLASGLMIRMARADTTAPRLLEVRVHNDRLLTLAFSEGMDSVGLSRAVQITDTVSGSPLQVRSVSVSLPERKELFVETDRQREDAGYLLTVSGLRDSSGLVISPLADRLIFTGSSDPDTVGPILVASPYPDSARNADVDGMLTLLFSEPLRAQDPEAVVELKDTLGPVAVERTWAGHAILLNPRASLRSLTWHTLSVRSGLLADLAGNRGADTVLVFRFQTLDTDRFSGVEGTVTDRSPGDTTGPIILSARRVDRKDAPVRTMQAEKSGRFSFDRLLEGRYILEAFRDRNANGSYDAGSVFPFEPSERFVARTDTLRLRARWPQEGIELKLEP